MTREEFANAYASRCGLTVEALREFGYDAFPCDCGYEHCDGWQMAPVLVYRLGQLAMGRPDPVPDGPPLALPIDLDTMGAAFVPSVDQLLDAEQRTCPDCGRVMSRREWAEQRICNDCQGGR